MKSFYEEFSGSFMKLSEIGTPEEGAYDGDGLNGSRKEGARHEYEPVG